MEARKGGELEKDGGNKITPFVQIGTYPITLHPTVQLKVLNKCTYSELLAYSEV